MSSTITRGASPVLEIYTDIEPINIVYTKNNMTFYDLCVDILAIAGGSVATIGVLNAFYHYLFGIKWADMYISSQLVIYFILFKLDILVNIFTNYQHRIQFSIFSLISHTHIKIVPSPLFYWHSYVVYIPISLFIYDLRNWEDLHNVIITFLIVFLKMTSAMFARIQIFEPFKKPLHTLFILLCWFFRIVCSKSMQERPRIST